MIYLFSGDDAKNKILNYEKFIKSLPKGLETLFINKNTFNPMQIESFYSGAGLFSPTSAIIFQDIFEREETGDFVLDKLEQMGQSDSSFVFLEGKLRKLILDAFKKALPTGRQAERFINVFELPKEKKERFDSFLLANAFAEKNKLSTWVYFREAMEREVAMEELIGVLFWKIKDLLLRKNFSKFTEAELKNLAGKISYLLPEARKKGVDAESAFEQFLLEVF